MNTTALFAVLLLLPAASFAADPPTGAPPPTVEHISNLSVPHSGIPVQLKKNEAIVTKESFAPPVEITIVAKTNSTNLRIGYAADQVIFNWERDQQQLRVDGGPANGKHKAGAGLIPRDTYVTIRWVVTPFEQAIYVDGQLRFQHSGNYTKLNRPVSVFCAAGSKVAVKSITTRALPPSPQA